MAESRLVPSNLMAWPRIRDLLPDQKLIVYHLWATMGPACGCGLVDLGGFQGALSITRSALEEAFREFERRGLVVMDEENGELFIKDWFRFHKFASPSRLRLLEDSILKIQSPKLKAIVEESAACVLREGKGREDNNPPPSPRGDEGEGGAGGGGGVIKKEGVSKEEEEELKEALENEARVAMASGKIANPSAWVLAALRRIKKEGLGEEEKALLERWRKTKAQAAALEEARNRAPWEGTGEAPPPRVGPPGGVGVKEFLSSIIPFKNRPATR